jgi:hypothetical protein
MKFKRWFITGEGETLRMHQRRARAVAALEAMGFK